MLVTIFDPNNPGPDFFSQRFLDEVVHNVAPAVWPTVVALAAAIVLTPLAALLAHRIGFLAFPRERDIHSHPVPYLGGAAMYLAFAISSLLFLRQDPVVPGLLVLGGITTAILALDDRFGIPALVKLGIQIAIAVVAVLVFGFGIHFVFLPLIHIRNLGLFVLPVTVVWIVGMQNTVNLLDGLDGLAAGVVAVVALVLLVAATDKPSLASEVALSGALAGACIGFLLFNFYPARIFMGDSGAHFLGLAVALLAVVGVAKIAVTAALVVPVLAMAVPIVDTAIAIVRRRRSGQPIAHADTRHLHHRLLQLGLNQREVCLLFYCSTGILGAIGLTVFGHRRILAVAMVLMVVVLSTVLGERLRASRRTVPLPFDRVFRLLLQGRAVR